MFIVKSVNPKNKIVSYFANYIDIPMFGMQVQITNYISEAKVFESNGEAAQAANAMGKNAVIEPCKSRIPPYVIRGQFSEDDNAFLYWNNSDGWVLRNDATVFKKSILYYPIESTGTEPV